MNIRFILLLGALSSNMQNLNSFPRNTINNPIQRNYSSVSTYMGGFKGRVHSTERENHY